MPAGATKWIWENSRASNGSLIVLLAIADELDAKGNCVMSLPELARKTRLSQRAVRNGVADLARLGELKAVSGGSGRGHRTAYAMPGNLAESATFTEESATFEPETRQNLPPSNPAESATFRDHNGRSEATSAESATLGISNMLLTVTGSSLVPVKDVPTKPPRDDIDRLCEHLADKIEANGSKRPVVNAKWRNAARLLIDKDGRTEEQIRAAIDWCQQDEFWRANILSMPKLREKYDQLRMHAMRGRPSSVQSNSNLDVVARYIQRVGNGNTQ